ncbi:HAD family hydrolase [Streptacidiphilus sp. MAP5-52]|uniref:HAD family hydrolase n=1 Tax=Streptacidiphilus sp. MAP5-52 TaxID=3156267 RepID=UPI003511C3B7
MAIDLRPHLPVHIVWNWTGALRDTVSHHVAALNQILPGLGRPTVTADAYRVLSKAPARLFCDEVFGDHLDDAGRNAVLRTMAEVIVRTPAHLHPDARRLVLLLRAQGVTQSLLSPTGDNVLLYEVLQCRLIGAMTRIEGFDDKGARSRTDTLTAHLRVLAPTVTPARTIVVSNSIDDALAARAVGAVPVLFTGGHDTAGPLPTTGVACADTLEEAVTAGLAALTHRRSVAACA